jgi:hypothetical protein
MDPRQPSRWLGLQAGWELDHAKGTARCTSVLQKDAGHLEGRIEFPLHYRFVHLADGRTLLLGQAKAALVSELLPDGSVRDLAMIGGTHLFCYACGWDPPPAYRAAFAKAFPDKPNDVSAKGPGVLWLDRNGDGACQAEEFEFTPAGIQFAGGYWGNGQSNLTLRFPARRDGQAVLITLQPDGFLPSGAPNYPTLAAACQAAVPLELDNPAMVTTADRFGNLLVSGEPWLTGHGPDGRTLWRFPNRWVNVHGSHPAPLPEPGVMQGNLFFLGPAPLDASSDVTVLVGNHGRHFVVTSDGLYLDELFTDVRLSRDRDAQLVGGEPFGGGFTKGDDGTYYLQTGGSGYRLYHLEGLGSVARTTGRLSVTPEHLAAAERQLARQRAAARAVAPDQASPIAWTRDGKFPVTVEFSVVGEDLRLRYTVADESPWVNQGRDWTVLFKTGDAVDFHFAADSAAPAKRREPVPGDCRLLVAPSAEGNVAVLYDFRVPGTTAPVQFASPARSVAVDRVVRLERARIAIEKRSRGYVATVTVPLADLGLTPRVAALRGDVGVIYGDREGTLNLLRSYWANPATALVNDVPGEAMLQPERWGTLRFGGATAGWTLRAVGVLGNSGEEGEALVRFGAKPARGMGVAVDGSGAIWDRGGDRTLLRYAPDGRLLGSYPLPGGSDTRDRVTLAGDWLVLLLGGQLYRLPVSAAPGTAPENLKQSARTISASSHGGKVAFAAETELGLLDPASGERTVVGAGPQDNWSDIELLPDGKVVVPRELRDSIGERPQFLGGWWYGALWHGTIRRHDASLAPAPGVVLGGSSGYFIGHVAQNTELENCRGLGLLPDGHFAASGLTGVLHLLRWVEAEKRFTIMRRLGALAEVRGLAMDRQGRIFCDRGVWQWDDAPTTPLELGIASVALGMPLVAGDVVAGPGVQYGDRPRWIHGTLDSELTTASLDDLAWEKPLIGTVSWLERNVRRALPLDETGAGPLLQLGGRGEPHKLLGRLALAPAEPVARFTSVTQLDDDTVVAAAAGQVLVFARQEGAWRETKRWGEWPGDHFGERLFLAASDGRLWVADTERHRVLVFGALGAAPLGQVGTTDQAGSGRHELASPERLSAAGERGVVYDRGNQRLVRLLLVAQPSETVTATGGR